MNFSLTMCALRARGSGAPKKAKSRSYALVIVVVIDVVVISQQAASVSLLTRCKLKHNTNKIIYTHTNMYRRSGVWQMFFCVYIRRSERERGTLACNNLICMYVCERARLWLPPLHQSNLIAKQKLYLCLCLVVN